MNWNVKNLTIILVATLSLAAGRLAAQDTNTNAAPLLDPQYFKLIGERNIFNPNRSTAVKTQRIRTERPRVDSFTLRGTMSYESNSLAFFDGSSSEYHRTLAPGQIIGGYRIAAITTDYVQLAASSNQFLTLKVGTQMRRQNGGSWKLVNTPIDSSDDSSTPPPMTPTEANLRGTSSAGGGEGRSSSSSMGSAAPADDVIKRLMQKRAQENKDKE